MEQQYISSIQPDLWVSGVRITEPVIALTSFLLTFVCAYAWLRLGATTQSRYRDLLRFFFLFMGLSSLYGGVFGHAFLHLVPFSWKVPGWLLGMAATAALAQAAIEDARTKVGPMIWRWLTILNWGGLGIAATAVSIYLFFPLVEAHAAFCLLLLLVPLQFLGLSRNAPNHWHNSLMLWGVGYSVLAVLPHVFKFSCCRWFSYFDIGHLLMCVAFWAFMRAGEVRKTEGFAA